MSSVENRLATLLTEVMDMAVSLEHARDISAAQRFEVQLGLSLLSDQLEDLVALVSLPHEHVVVN